MSIEQVAAQLEALGKATRLELYRRLVRAGDDGLPVGRLQSSHGIPASTLSHHLKRVVECQLVPQERQATTLICRAVYWTMNRLIGFLADECCADGACGTVSETATV